MSLCKLAPSAAADGTMWPLRQHSHRNLLLGSGLKVNEKDRTAPFKNGRLWSRRVAYMYVYVPG